MRLYTGVIGDKRITHAEANIALLQLSEGQGSRNVTGPITGPRSILLRQSVWQFDKASLCKMVIGSQRLLINCLHSPLKVCPTINQISPSRSINKQASSC